MTNPRDDLKAAVERHLPLTYKGGPDYCEVFDNAGDKVALTSCPELFQQLEAAARKTLLPEWVVMEIMAVDVADKRDDKSVAALVKAALALSRALTILALGRALAKTEGEG